MVKPIVVAAVAAVFVSVSASAQMRGGRSGQPSNQQNKANKVKISHMPKPDVSALVPAPAFQAQAAGNLQPPINKRPRRWALFELKYATSADWVDELTFTWHVLAKAEGAELSKSEKAAKLEGGEPTVTPYSYYTATVRYVNIPRGDHMACVALPPSTVEHFGKPVCISVEITDKNGNSLEVKTEDTSGVSKADPKGRWWEAESVMNSSNPALKIARRNGLVDRAKTPFALLNSSDYENVE